MSYGQCETELTTEHRYQVGSKCPLVYSKTAKTDIVLHLASLKVILLGDSHMRE